MHSKKDINARYPNAVKNQRLDGLLAVEQKSIVVNRASQVCVVFRHDDFPNKTLHCVYRYVTVVEEGDPLHLCTEIPNKRSKSIPSSCTTQQNDSCVLIPSGEQNDANLPPHLLGDDCEAMLDDSYRNLKHQYCDELAETIRQVKELGYKVDDDNEALPENVPHSSEKQNFGDGDEALRHLSQSWGCDGIDERAKVGVEASQPKIKHGMDDIVFEKFLIYKFLFFI